MPPEQIPTPTTPNVTSVKSSLWIWTTLWLTTVFDAAFVIIAYRLLAYFVQGALPPSMLSGLTFVSNSVIPVIAIIIGSYLACHYVLKRAVIQKADAGKFAGLSILIPVIGNVVLLGVAIMIEKGPLDMLKTAIYIGGVLISFASMYLIIRSQLEKRGE